MKMVVCYWVCVHESLIFFEDLKQTTISDSSFSKFKLKMVTVRLGAQLEFRFAVQGLF